jgi:hypothetical protein
MLQLANQTGFAATILAAPDPNGIDSLYAVVKGTFSLAKLDAQGVPARTDEQLPPVLANEHYADAAVSSIRVPSDVSLMKPSTDVLLIGTAYAANRATTWMDVTLSCGPVRKIVRVFGDRSWRGAVSTSATAPQRFESVPLLWERAYGGLDQAKGQPRGEARNPVGAGFRASDGEKLLDGLALPNLEDPYEPITSWKQTPAPAAFAPIPAHWQPRVSFAGTYDEAWQSKRAPYLPQDFDARFFQLAPPGLVAPAYLQGGEVVDITGATPSGRLAFRLPQVALEIEYQLDNKKEKPPVHLDTVIIEPDHARVVLVWRTVLACDKKLLRVREIAVRLQ